MIQVKTTSNEVQRDAVPASSDGERGWLLVILMVACCLRAYRLGERSLWFDEAFSWVLANDYPFHEMVSRTAADVHPPFYYAVLRLWCCLFGDSEYAMRGFSVLLGGLTIVAVYHLARDVFQCRRVGMAAAALVACNAFHIHWSQEARMYTLGTLLAVAGAYSLLRAMQRTMESRKWWTQHVICCVAFLYTHNYSIFNVAGWFGFALFSSMRLGDRRLFTETVLAYLMIAFAYSWWLPVLWCQTRLVQDEFWIAQFSIWTIPEAYVELFFPSNTHRSPEAWLTVSLGLSFVALFAVCCLCRDQKTWLMMVSALAPVLGAAVTSSTVVSVTVPRYLMFALMFTLCLIAGVAMQIRSPAMRRGVLAILMLGELSGHFAFQSELNAQLRPGLRAAAAMIQAKRSPTAMIVTLHPALQTSVKYYLRGTDSPRLYFPKTSLLRLIGGPVIRDEEFVAPQDLESTTADELWTVDTSGFLQRSGRWTMPDCWSPVFESNQSFREVYWFQRDVFIVRWRRRVAVKSDEIWR